MSSDPALDARRIPDPPTFDADHPIETLGTHEILHRVFAAGRAPAGFVASTHEMRFSPIYDGNTLVPVWYAGATLTCALLESVFHDVADRGKRQIDWTYLETRRYCTVCPTVPLRLVSLKGTALSRYGYETHHLTATPGAQFYRRTARWAQAVYQQFPESHGIVWNSSKADGAATYMLFGNGRAETLLKTRSSGVTVVEDTNCIEHLNHCMDLTGTHIAGHPDSSPTILTRLRHER